MAGSQKLPQAHEPQPEKELSAQSTVCVTGVYTRGLFVGIYEFRGAQ